MAKESSVRVICRFRPLSKAESADAESKSFNLSFPSLEAVTLQAQLAAKQSFSFDRVFDPSASQVSV